MSLSARRTEVNSNANADCRNTFTLTPKAQGVGWGKSGVTLQLLSHFTTLIFQVTLFGTAQQGDPK